MHIDSHNPRNPKINGPIRRYGPMVGSAVAGYGALTVGAMTGNMPVSAAITAYSVGALGSMLGLPRALNRDKDSIE